MKAKGLTVETGDSRMVWEDKPIGRKGQGGTRPVAGYRDPDTGDVVFTDPGWSSNPGKAWASWDTNGHLPDSLDGSAATSAGVRIVPGQKTWKEYGLPDLREIDQSSRLFQPVLLRAAGTREKAVEMTAETLGVSVEKPLRVVETPIDQVAIRYEWLGHLVEKQGDARERYANYILPTLTSPHEIWLTEYDDGNSRFRYLGLFQGDNDLMSIVRINKDGSLLWNIMQAKDKNINKMRVGGLLWRKEKTL